MNELDINYLSDQGSSALIFEPSELIEFKRAWQWQRQWQKKLLTNPSSPQAIWLLQHYECYTLGRSGSKENLLFNAKKPPFDLFHIDRGGEVTHHLPGQLVTYLVLDLHRYQTDLNWYLRQIEAVLLDVISELGLYGQTLDGLTGIWVNGFKVASVGISCKRWITQHGCALNINCNLSGFDQIIPCGLKGHQVGRLDSWLPGLTTKDVQPLLKKAFIKRFAL